MAHTLAVPVQRSLSFLRNTINPSKPTFNSLSFPASSILSKIGGLSVKCFRVGGVEIPNSKRLEFSLQYIHGIGRTKAKQILCRLGMANKLTKDLSAVELANFREEVSKYMIGGDLRRATTLDIGRLKEIQCYRGIRHIDGLPCRGQRTKTNSRTMKEKKVNPVAGKKKSSR